MEADAALLAILQGTATETGHGFFYALAQNLAGVLGTHGAWVTEYFPEQRRLRALAFWIDGHWVKDYEVDIAGTPCERVIETAQLVHFPDHLLDIYLHEDRTFTTVILRDVRDRVEAEQKIQSLTVETELLREELHSLHHDSSLIGDSPALRQVLRDIAQVGPTDATVLIVGETGTGKELVARANHRHERPLITVNCAAIPATLIESEFFGHEPGAFTGATKKREGRFALTDKGTIFLDDLDRPVDRRLRAPAQGL